MKTLLTVVAFMCALIACPGPTVTPPLDACADASPLVKKACPTCPCQVDAASPTPAPKVDAAPAPPTTGYAAVCQHLALLGCQEGQNPNCANLIGKVQDAALGDLKPACLSAATSVAAIRACGTVTCTSAAKKK